MSVKNSMEGLVAAAAVGTTRMLYDRVRKSKICFEITAFLNYERGISRAGEFKTSNVNNKKKFVIVFI